MRPVDDGDLAPPALRWEAQTPIHQGFDDRYYSAEDGAAEARYVYLAHNELPARWRGRQRFCIGEIGFGTGLNFFLSWQLWRQQAAPGAVLDYVSFEAQPMTAADRRRALSPWPELEPLREAFAAQDPGGAPGFHCLRLPGARLLLIHGDAAQLLPQLRARVEAWYFDGFAPARNPQLWQVSLLQAAAAASAPAASFATFSAAGQVRRALEAAGFEPRKDRGFGRKREMLFGHLARAPAAADPWFCYPPAAPGPVRVIGGGLAGACTARALAEAGREVRLYTGLQSGCSVRIPAMLVRPYPERQASLASQLYAAAASRAQRDYPRWCPQAFLPLPIQHPSGPPLAGGRLLSPSAVSTLIEHPRIERLGADADPDESGLRILCTGRLPESLALGAPLQAVAGQCLRLATSPGPAARLSRLQWLPLAAGGLLGSSYRPGDSALDTDEAESRRLLSIAAADWADFPAAPEHRAYTGLRFASPDHLPLLGPCPLTPAWQQDYAELHHGRPAAHYPPAALEPGLWLNLAHGSRGASLAPLAAELIAAGLDAAPLPLPATLLAAVHPGRFLLRRLRQAPG